MGKGTRLVYFLVSLPTGMNLERGKFPDRVVGRAENDADADSTTVAPLKSRTAILRINAFVRSADL